MLETYVFKEVVYMYEKPK